MKRDHWIGVAFLGAALVLVGTWWVLQRRADRRAEPQAVERKGPPPHPLVKEMGVNKIYSFDEKTQEVLLSAVEHYCVKEYHAPSCIHHLATCGNPCLIAIPKDKRKKIFDDYQALRVSKGLPALNVIKEDED
ncbi:MAG: hypothetical protein AB7F86_19835 [Bdellovibrionales bacterium]